ncbi:MAG: polysaccharide biosynthesis tyrosine autokinase [Acidimicrobiales bacterium]
MMYNPEFADTENTTLEDYLRGIRSHRLAIVVCALAGLLAGLFVFSQLTPSYKSTVSVILGPTRVGSANDTPRAPVLEREAEVLTSDAVAQQVIDRLSLDTTTPALLTTAEVTFLPRSEILDLEITAGSPEDATDIANAFGEVYVEQAEAADAKLLEDRVAVLRQEQENAVAAIDEATAELDRLQELRADQLAESPSDAQAAAVRDTEALLSTAQTVYNLGVAQMRTVSNDLDVAIRALNTRAPSARLLRQATEPTSPSGPSQNVRPRRPHLRAGRRVVLAIVLDRLDTTANDEHSVGLALGAGVLTKVPRLPFKARSGRASLVMQSDAKSGRVQEARESYRRLRSSAQFISSNLPEPDQALVVMITSAFPGEGKSVTSANLAASLATSGSRVVLINADMRRPTVEGLFGIDNGSGLSMFLGGVSDQSLDSLGAVEIDGIPGLWVIPSGPIPANPAELLNSPRFKTVIGELRESVDYVVIDCPPALSTSDPLTVAPLTDGVIVVIDSRRTETDDLLEVRSSLENTGAKILGAVLNRSGRRRQPWWSKDRYAYR